MKLFLSILIGLFGFQTFGQIENDAFKKQFVDYSILYGRYNHNIKEAFLPRTEKMFINNFYGVNVRYGYNLFLKRNQKLNWIIKFTWLRAGFVVSEGARLTLAPLQLGFGSHFKINDHISIEPCISGGALFLVNANSELNAELTYSIIPEMKFNFNDVSLGIEYSFRKTIDIYQREGLFQYFGLSIGNRF